MLVKRDMQIYAGWEPVEARNFCKKNNLTKEMVKLVERDKQILVIARKEFEWKKSVEEFAQRNGRLLY